MPQQRASRFSGIDAVSDAGTPTCLLSNCNNGAAFDVSVSAPGGENVTLKIEDRTSPSAWITLHTNTTAGSSKSYTQPATRNRVYVVTIGTPDPEDTPYFLRWGNLDCSQSSGSKPIRKDGSGFQTDSPLTDLKKIEMAPP